MRIIKLLALTIIALFSVTTSQARKTEVWDHPAIEFGSHNGDGYFNVALDVTKVELNATETVVHMTVRQRPDSGGSHFDSNIYLNVGGKRYTAVSVDGIAFNEVVRTHQDGRLDVAFHFPPVPPGTRHSTSWKAMVRMPFRLRVSSLWRSVGSSCSLPIGVTQDR